MRAARDQVQRTSDPRLLRRLRSTLTVSVCNEGPCHYGMSRRVVSAQIYFSLSHRIRVTLATI